MKAIKVLAVCLALATWLQAQRLEETAPAEQSAQTFRLDPRWPFIYLKFDHIGKGARANGQEPSTRIWLHLVNNCRLPIVVRGGPAAPGGIKNEVLINGVVRPNPRIDLLIATRPRIEPNSAPIPTTLTEPGVRQGQSSPANSESQSEPTGDDGTPMPLGYPALDVVSTETIMPDTDVLFSIPVNFVTRKWHFEITVGLGSEVADESIPEQSFFTDESVRGEARIILSYGFWDLPRGHQDEVERLNQSLAKKH